MASRNVQAEAATRRDDDDLKEADNRIARKLPGWLRSLFDTACTAAGDSGGEE